MRARWQLPKAQTCTSRPSDKTLEGTGANALGRCPINAVTGKVLDLFRLALPAGKANCPALARRFPNRVAHLVHGASTTIAMLSVADSHNELIAPAFRADWLRLFV